MDAWDEEKIKGDADMELLKLVTEEIAYTYSEEQIAQRLKKYKEERKQWYLAERRKRKLLKEPTVKQKRKYYEQYLRNIKGYKLVQLKPYTDDEITKMYEKAKREIDAFIPMGSEDQVKIAKTVMETESVKEVETEKVEEKKVEEKEEKKITSGSGVKSPGVFQRSVGKKKGKANTSKAIEQASEFEHEEESSDGDEHIPSKYKKEQMESLTVVSRMSEPKVVDSKPIGVKHPITSNSSSVNDGSEPFWDVIRTDGRCYMFLRLRQMLYYFEREDVETLWRIMKKKFGDTKFPKMTFGDHTDMNDYVMWKSLKLCLNPLLKIQSGKNFKRKKL